MKLKDSYFNSSIDDLTIRRRKTTRWVFIDGTMALFQLVLCLSLYYIGYLHLAFLLSVGILMWAIEVNSDKKLINWIDFVLYIKRKELKDE